ncbi:protein PXR1 [Ricinus communis]|uniref:protein PXR1 n=1 Tax=Ricinus communis TaxID=3988 RepID=UPI00201A69C2|nr:protein PXR1 [Ricinus communis]
MEIEGDDGSRIEVESDGFETVFGRGLGYNTKDRTVSRRHVLFKTENNQTEPRVSFQVIGKNPLWVRKSGESERDIKVFRKFDKGEVGAGDWFCISSQNPVWFNLKKIGAVKEENDLESENLERNNLSQIDPVKEFGFLVIGHEFDCYPKQRIKDANNWDWFIEEPEQDSEDDDERFENNKKRKREKKSGDNYDDDDDDWSGESEEDKVIVGKISKVERSKYSTRSKDRKNKTKTCKDTARKKDSLQKKTMSIDNDEDDETLGGFIVNDADEEEEENGGESDEEEEEFTDEEEEELED